jgi:methylamine dehydrogenase heavy chain
MTQWGREPSGGRRTRARLRAAAVLGWVGLLGAAACAAAATVPPPLPAEQLTVEQLGPQSPHWAYVVDEAFQNEIDARVYLFDGDSDRRLGQIGAGFYPGAILSPDGKTTAVATTYFSRGTRGERTDVVEFTDNATLEATGEIMLPPKRALTIPTIFNLAYSSDGRFLYVAYITPADSFGVLDPTRKKVLGEIGTAGCVLVIPWGRNQVSSLCESGRLLTVELDAQGREASRFLSQPFFDADKDPVFVQGIPTAKGYEFISFLGEVHDLDFTSGRPSAMAPWSLVDASDRGRWRPGGVQIGALHRGLGRLYVPMHRGGEGSHKEGGSEIWVFDNAHHVRIARWRVPSKSLGAVIAVAVTQDEHPLLFAATDSANLLVFDALTGKLHHVEKALGQTPWLILTPDVHRPN